MGAIKRRFIYVGILVWVASIVLDTASSAILRAIAVTLTQNGVPIVGVTESILGTVRLGLAPLGAILIAIGIALHWLRDYLPNAPASADQDIEQAQP
ncbi:hypothetical protein [Sinomonas albida]|uniref:hypothetical protein n=1 Tax=Sinomonas albida TaxID=369942 RepID=UPI0010A8E377|nr:hypothetical protein [Sinomonas albida]